MKVPKLPGEAQFADSAGRQCLWDYYPDGQTLTAEGRHQFPREPVGQADPL
jgi:hypothetical protein